jgi:hypothetical protein
MALPLNLSMRMALDMRWVERDEKRRYFTKG